MSWLVAHNGGFFKRAGALGICGESNGMIGVRCLGFRFPFQNIECLV